MQEHLGQTKDWLCAMVGASVGPFMCRRPQGAMTAHEANENSLYLIYVESQQKNVMQLVNCFLIVAALFSSFSSVILFYCLFVQRFMLQHGAIIFYCFGQKKSLPTGAKA